MFSFHSFVGLLTDLFFLFMGNNMISGAIPTEIGELVYIFKYTKIMVYLLIDSYFPFFLFIVIGLMRRLLLMDFESNDLSGTIPTHIGTLVSFLLFDCYSSASDSTVAIMLCSQD